MVAQNHSFPFCTYMDCASCLFFSGSHRARFASAPNLGIALGDCKTCIPRTKSDEFVLRQNTFVNYQENGDLHWRDRPR